MPAAGFDPERHARRLAPVGAVLAVTGGCLGGWGGLLAAALGVVLLLLACFSRNDGLLVLGPFVRAELVRAARGRRPWLWRSIYAVAAGLILVGNVWASAQPLMFGRALSPAHMAYLNEKVAVWFALCLFGYVCVLTVQLIAPIVAEEREAKRWDVLLATDLRAREILVGKAVGRLPLVLDPVLASLPVLALTPLLGGVSPRLVLTFGAATVAAVIGLTGVAFFYSTFAPTARVATGRTWFLVVLYVFGTAGLALAARIPFVGPFPTSVGVPSPVTVDDLVALVGVANPIYVVMDASLGLSGGPGGFEDRFDTAVGRFVAAQLGVALLFGLTAAGRLRHAKVWAGPAPKAPPVPAEAPADGTKQPRPRVPVRRALRPPVGERPVYWWQRYGELKAGRAIEVLVPTAGKYLRLWLVFLGLFVFTYLLDFVWPWGRTKVWNVIEGLTLFALWGGSLMMMFPALFRAAASVARERAADTLDSLRLTALDSREILFEKWLGCATVEWPLFKVTLTFAAAGTVTGYVHPLSLLGYAVVVPVYTGAAAGLGLYFSVRAATPGRASRNMVLIGLAVLYVLGTVLSAPLFGRRHEEARVAIVIPPMVTGMILAAGPAVRESRGRVDRDVERAAIACVLGPLAWSLAGWLAWRAAVRRFEAERQG